MIFLNLLIPACILLGSMNRTDCTVLIQKESLYLNGKTRIGLLIDNKSSLAAKHAAEMAISEANNKAGATGMKFELVVRSMEGPWGTGSKQTVNLIFDENVIAIAGSHDGRNAHLAEQVCAKSGVTLISARASDPTLSQAFVPWYFSCVPNDDQQASVLFEEITLMAKESEVLLISENSYDAKQASKSYIRKNKSKGLKEPEVFSYNDYDNDLSGLAASIKRTGKKCIVIFGKPPSAIKLLKEIRKIKPEIIMFASLSIMDENKLPVNELYQFEDLYIVSPGLINSPKWTEFSKEYQRLYGYAPGAIASFSYDAMNVIIEAINETGPDQELMQNTIAKRRFNGVTGPIEFDEHGNRKWPFGMIIIKNGIPTPVR